MKTKRVCLFSLFNHEDESVTSFCFWKTSCCTFNQQNMEILKPGTNTWVTEWLCDSCSALKSTLKLLNSAVTAVLYAAAHTHTHTHTPHTAVCDWHALTFTGKLLPASSAEGSWSWAASTSTFLTVAQPSQPGPLEAGAGCRQQVAVQDNRQPWGACL